MQFKTGKIKSSDMRMRFRFCVAFSGNEQGVNMRYRVHNYENEFQLAKMTHIFATVNCTIREQSTLHSNIAHTTQCDFRYELSLPFIHRLFTRERVQCIARNILYIAEMDIYGLQCCLWFIKFVQMQSVHKMFLCCIKMSHRSMCSSSSNRSNDNSGRSSKIVPYSLVKIHPPNLCLHVQLFFVCNHLFLMCINKMLSVFTYFKLE